MKDITDGNPKGTAFASLQTIVQSAKTGENLVKGLRAMGIPITVGRERLANSKYGDGCGGGKKGRPLSFGTLVTSSTLLVGRFFVIEGENEKGNCKKNTAFVKEIVG